MLNPVFTNILSAALLAAGVCLGSAVLAQTDLGVARYTDSRELIYPDNLDEWIHTGSLVGGRYSDTPPDPSVPGTIQVVQMEPAAYRYFRDHGEFAEGTMFLLSFYAPESKSDPQLQGYVQGALQAQEIHVVDSERFTEGHAFFMFDTPEHTPSSKIPDGSDCVACHTSEAAYRGTFTQFYPVLRDRL